MEKVESSQRGKGMPKITCEIKEKDRDPPFGGMPLVYIGNGELRGLIMR